MPVVAIQKVELSMEWDRIGLLAERLESQRNGKPLSVEAKDRLSELQSLTERLRRRDGWSSLAVAKLSGLECDILAAAVAPQATPRIAWQYKRLQPGMSDPYPTLALLQELLVLENSDCHKLFHALRAAGPLVQERLVAIEGEGPLRVVMPGPGVTERLLGQRSLHGPPPGAVPVVIRGCWDDLVLGKDQKERLRELVIMLRHKRTVVSAWGGHNTGGPVALFAGPSGTGKTFAASVIAGEVGWPLFSLDLGMLAGNRISETEKNVRRLLHTLHSAEILLQIDDVDALLSKQVDEYRHHHSKMLVRHVLSRLEFHDGPVIIATSKALDELDPAFVRRFHLVVDFPPPNAASRSELWRRLVPPFAPLEKELDFAELGNAVELTGGSILNAALHAAFLAAADAKAIGKREVAQAVWRELKKQRRQVSRSELGTLTSCLQTHPASKRGLTTG